MTVMNKENSKVFLLILLGMLSAFGPFVTDMYLPSLPAMADYFLPTRRWCNWDLPPV